MVGECDWSVHDVDMCTPARPRINGVQGRQIMMVPLERLATAGLPGLGLQLPFSFECQRRSLIDRECSGFEPLNARTVDGNHRVTNHGDLLPLRANIQTMQRISNEETQWLLQVVLGTVRAATRPNVAASSDPSIK